MSTAEPASTDIDKHTRNVLSLLEKNKWDNFVPRYTPEEKRIIEDYKEVGLNKRLSVIIHPYGGKKLYLKDQNHQLIGDPVTLKKSEYAIITNCRPGSGAEGCYLFCQDVIINGEISFVNKFQFRNDQETCEVADSISAFDLDNSKSYHRVKIVN